MGKIILYRASYMDWKPVDEFPNIEALKKECVDQYGFPEESLDSDEEFNNWLDEIEMKYEMV